jgi:hypothetical protein
MTSQYSSHEQRHGGDLSKALFRRLKYSFTDRHELALVARQERLRSHQILEKQDVSC